MITIARAARAWPHEAHLSYAEGIWIGLAVDTAHGVFYRPLEGPLGYGGTRYFPLFFAAHAALIRLGLPPVTAGYALSGASVALLALGVFLFVRRAGGDALLAVLASAVALSVQPTQMALLAIRGDALPAALAIGGLACCLPAPRPRLAAVCFTLAFAAKPTSLYAPAAAVMTLWLAAPATVAARVSRWSLAGLVAVAVVLVAASAGRAVAVFAASAGGGGGAGTLIGAPVSLLRILRRVPESAFFLQCAAASLVAGFGRPVALERVAFVAALGTSLLIYASPGTVENHLIDIAILSVLVVAGWAPRERRVAHVVVALLMVGGLSSGATAAWRFQTEDRLDLAANRRPISAALATTRSPILVVQPMLVADRREPPYLLDPYLASVRIAADPSAADRLVRDIDGRQFGAIVLEHADLDMALQEFVGGDTKQRVRAALERSYSLDRIVEGRSIYRPR